jgi:hypothetical protein
MITRLLALFSLTVILACGNESEPPPSIPDSEQYFPLSIGRSITYAVDSIVFDDAPGGNTRDTVSFQLREEIVGKVLAGTGDSAFVIHRFRRDEPTGPWVLRDVYTSGIAGAEALRTEENVTFVKMTFPLWPGNGWVSTAYISPETVVQVGTENLEPYEYWESLVLDVDVAGQVGDVGFANGQLMHVRQVDADDGLTKRTVLETYARNVGLVERIDTILDSRCIALGDFGPCVGKSWLQHAGKGYILRQTLIEYR